MNHDNDLPITLGELHKMIQSALLHGADPESWIKIPIPLGASPITNFQYHEMTGVFIS